MNFISRILEFGTKCNYEEQKSAGDCDETPAL